MTPKQQYQKAYSAVRFEMIDWENEPPPVLNDRSAVDELLALPPNVVGLAYQHYLITTFTVDKLQQRAYLKQLLAIYCPDIPFNAYQKAKLPPPENACDGSQSQETT